jgi:hypothetical protein
VARDSAQPRPSSGGATAGAARSRHYRDPAQRSPARPSVPARLSALTEGTGARAAGVFAGGRDLAADREAAARVLLGFRDPHRTEIAGEDRQYLAQMVAARTGLTPEEAQRRVAAVEADARAAADNARRIGMHLSFWLVASMLLGGLAASLAAIEGGAARDGRS